MMGLTHRAAPRYPASLRVAFSEAEEFLSDRVTNISAGGMFVQTDRKLRAGALVSVALEFPDGDRPAPVQAKIVHVSRSRSRKPRPPAGVGVQFVESGDAFRLRVDRYIESLLRTSTVPAVRILTIARDLLAENGWTQVTERDAGGRYCLTGALSQAAGDDEGAYQAALQSVGSRLEVPGCSMGGFGCHCPVVNWNDAEGRTERQVLAKLDDVISAELRASSGPA